MTPWKNLPPVHLKRPRGKGTPSQILKRPYIAKTIHAAMRIPLYHRYFSKKINNKKMNKIIESKYPRRSNTRILASKAPIIDAILKSPCLPGRGLSSVSCRFRMVLFKRRKRESNPSVIPSQKGKKPAPGLNSTV
ncbi:MAG: hypothetical protein QME90_14455 [Thermodesulfobacteriota bacterium]|nr:hypothetical protein [Thermodesulfobacteriota bacterium]